jgi:hypothetical protein
VESSKLTRSRGAQVAGPGRSHGQVCTVRPNICAPSVLKFFNTFLVPIIFKWLLDSWNFCGPLKYGCRVSGAFERQDISLTEFLVNCGLSWRLLPKIRVSKVAAAAVVVVVVVVAAAAVLAAAAVVVVLLQGCL